MRSRWRPVIPGLPTDDGNLVIRAARLLREAAGSGAGAYIKLDKRIPVAAGLGGGSSDAAAALWALNRVWGLRWSRDRLAEVAARIGSDVPFFLGRGRAVGTGRGERLRALTSGGGLALVLVNPNFPLSTAEVYGRVPAGWQGNAQGTAKMVDALRGRSVRRVAAALTNTLEGLVEPAVPAIGRMKAALIAAGALGRRCRAAGRRCSASRARSITRGDPPAGEPGGLVVLGRAKPLRPRDPRGLSRLPTMRARTDMRNELGRGQAVRRGTLDPVFGGSNPPAPATFFIERAADRARAPAGERASAGAHGL